MRLGGISSLPNSHVDQTFIETHLRRTCFQIVVKCEIVKVQQTGIPLAIEFEERETPRDAVIPDVYKGLALTVLWRAKKMIAERID